MTISRSRYTQWRENFKVASREGETEAKRIRGCYGGVYGMKEEETGGEDAKWKGKEGGEEQQDGHSQTLMPWRIVILVK